MRVLVTGASGLLGRAVMAAAQQRGYEVTGVGHSRGHGALRQLDLTDEDVTLAILTEVQPHVIIHTAAERRPDAMEANPESAHRLNVEVPAFLAKQCSDKEAGMRLIHISTDYVFDGHHPPYKPDDVPNPLNAYGRSKLDAEKAIQKYACKGQAVCVRVPVLYGETEYDAESAVNVLQTALFQTKSAKMDAHGIRYPTNVKDVAAFLMNVCEYDRGGLPAALHFSAQEALTKYEMCKVIADAYRLATGKNVSTDHLVPVTEPDSSASTQRPGNCHLDTQLSQELNLSVECVKFAIWWEEYFRDRYAHEDHSTRDKSDGHTDTNQDSSKPQTKRDTQLDSDTDEDRYGASSPVVQSTNATTQNLSTDSRESETRKNLQTCPPPYSFTVQVCDPQKIHDRVSSHVVYTVRVKSDAEWLGASECSALRRYSEFRWLHAALVHNHPGVIVPSIPEKVKLNNMRPDLVEYRRQSLEHALLKILQHPLLQRDDDLLLFLKSRDLAEDIKQRDALKGPIITPEQKTYFGWSQSLYNFKFRETDEWFNQQLDYLALLEARLYTITNAIHTLAQKRIEFAESQSNLYKQLVIISGSSLSRSVSTCFAALAELKKTGGNASAKLAKYETDLLELVFHEYERLIGNVRKAFSTRIDTWHAWQRADDDLAKLKAKNAKSFDGHLDAKLRAISSAELHSATLQTRFEDVSVLCKQEMQRFEQEKVADLRAVLAKYVNTFQCIQQEYMDELSHCESILRRHAGNIAVDTNSTEAVTNTSSAGQSVAADHKKESDTKALKQSNETNLPVNSNAKQSTELHNDTDAHHTQEISDAK
ncbi:Vacuolar protein sorting-associated protein vps5 [Malassezia yamatoensis]|uniref:Vacuolar protein sorting-associated protein vps5 n=1 Tax=Malassezia yamatoensis TaxID=253288 RepID=A0AAJ5YSP6_9BASI|nr:Vacuolar protein sorting-associated protein vps5 [Malassezia yamatoensis]